MLNRPYNDPDERWDAYSSSFDQFQKKYVVKPRFHSQVPDSIVKEFEMVEYLMAHSYYYYPMYDEVFGKMLRIMEISVKERLKQLGIIDDPVNSRRALQRLINDLAKAEPEKGLGGQLDIMREIRNYMAHPTAGTLLGTLTHLRIFEIYNLINNIFLDEMEFMEAKKLLKSTQQLVCHLADDLTVFEITEKRFLIRKLKCIKYFQIGKSWTSYWILYPIITNIKDEVLSGSLSSMFHLNFSTFDIKDQTIRGKTFEGQEVSISSSKKKEDRLTLEKYKKQVSEIDPGHFESYESVIEYMNYEQVVKFIYWNCWG